MFSGKTVHIYLFKQDNATLIYRSYYNSMASYQKSRGTELTVIYVPAG